jgi:hypothetical protein
MSKTSKYPKLPPAPNSLGYPLINPVASQDQISQAPLSLPVIHSLAPPPFSETSKRQVYLYTGEGNNGELKVFGTFAKLKKFLMDHHGQIYQGRRLSQEEFLEKSQGWGFELELVDYY